MTHRRTNLLPWIVAFKAFKSVSLSALGVALLTTRHEDPVDLLFRFALVTHLPLSSRLFLRALTWATTLTLRTQTALALTAFAYGILMAAEGLALHFRKPWARWFTIVATSSLMPLELVEIVREPRPLRMLVLVANAAIVVYLWKRKDIFD